MKRLLPDRSRTNRRGAAFLSPLFFRNKTLHEEKYRPGPGKGLKVVPAAGKFTAKGLFKNNMATLHLIFGPSLAVAQSQNPQRSAATPAVLR
jgi:hypothetical protein